MNAEPIWRPGLGDRISTIATPLALLLKLSCIDPITKQPKPDSGCAKRKAWLNSLTQPNKMKLNCTITTDDDNKNIILETRGRGQGTKVIARDANTAENLLAALDAAIEANKPPQRPQQSPAAATAPADQAAQE